MGSLKENFLKQKLEALAKKGQMRFLHARPKHSTKYNLRDNDYLRLSKHPELIKAAQEALEHWGNSSCASPFISGYTQAHQDLSDMLSKWIGLPHCLLWNSGYNANYSILCSLIQKEDVILMDRLCHNSLIEGALASKGAFKRYPHLDIKALENLLKKYSSPTQTIFVITESLFSMNGDIPNLEAIARLKSRFNFYWILDEAHAIGWYGTTGNGLAQETQTLQAVDVLIGTAGKALGSMGAFSLFKEKILKDYCLNFSKELRYSTYLPPAHACSIQKAIEIIQTMKKERTQARMLALKFKQSIEGAPQNDSPIVPIICGKESSAIKAGSFLEANNFEVGVIRPPTVPQRSSCLRISLNTSLQEKEYQALLKCLKKL